MVIFNSYVKLPEGIVLYIDPPPGSNYKECGQEAS